MVKDNKSSETSARESYIKQVNALLNGSGEKSMPALLSEIRALQKKVNGEIKSRRESIFERESERLQAQAEQKVAPPVKKAKPAPPPAPDETQQQTAAIEVPVVQATEPEVIETPVSVPVAEKTDAPKVKEVEVAPEKEPAPLRTRHFNEIGGTSNRSAVPSYIKGQYTPPPQRPASPSQGGRPGGGQFPPRTPRPSGAPGASRPFGQGAGRPMQTSGAGKAAAPLAPSKERTKTFDKKKEHAKPDDKKTMNKRTLIRKGFITEDFNEERMGTRKLKSKKVKEQQQFAPMKIEKAVITTENLTVKILSEKIGKTAQEILKQLMVLGIMCNINSVVDFQTMELVANELGVELELKLDKTKEALLEEQHDEVDDEADLQKRPPIITVMGHVDHGKTSLLDAIRKTTVADGEAGGITQHIGAYSVTAKGETITFLDTPGHEAFTEMRARGAKVTDIAILIVAADDGIMPQTIEAINHAKAAEVPVIVAINKIDKPGANIDRVKQGMTEHGIVPEEWGGDTPMVPISAKTGEGIDKLLEMILFMAEYNNYRANPKRMAKASIIESKLDKNRGPIANAVVLNGTLNVGDFVVSGLTSGKVRALNDDKGNSIKSAGPSMPVSVLGFNEVPAAGDQMFVVPDEKAAKQLVSERVAKLKTQAAGEGQKVTLDDVFARISEGEMKDLNILIKADVQGSVEALANSLKKLSNDEVKVNVVHGGVGAINKSDLMLAEVSNAVIIGFNVRPDSETKSAAESSGVDIRLYSIIYEAIDDVNAAIKGLVAPKFEENILGRAQVRNVIKVSGVGAIGGSYVLSGKIMRNAKVRIFRNDVVIFEGTIANLKRFKEDVREVAAGYECGISVDGFASFEENDEIEAFVSEQVKVK